MFRPIHVHGVGSNVICGLTPAAKVGTNIAVLNNGEGIFMEDNGLLRHGAWPAA